MCIVHHLFLFMRASQISLLRSFTLIQKELSLTTLLNFRKTPFMGPLIDDFSQKNYLNYMGMAKREGFEEVMRGKQIEKSHQGYYVNSINPFRQIKSFKR